jgi:hypothetical protein
MDRLPSSGSAGSWGEIVGSKSGCPQLPVMKYNRSSIIKANLKNRRIISIDNPDLPMDTPLNDPSLWFDPATMK